MTPAEYEFVILSVQDRVARITLNRPEKRNALRQEMGLELLDAFRTVGAMNDVRAVVLAGGPTAFSVGADLTQTTTTLSASGRPDSAWLLREVYNPLVTTLREIPQPVISVINGPTVGVGASIALAADLVFASEDAYILLPFVNIGLVPDGGATALVTQRVGHVRAAQMMLLSERLPATRAAEWGLVNDVLPNPDAAAARAEEVAAKLAAGPAVAQAAIKRLLGVTLGESLTVALAAEAMAQGVQSEGEESVEGIVAFLQKREPAFPDPAA